MLTHCPRNNDGTFIESIERDCDASLWTRDRNSQSAEVMRSILVGALTFGFY